MNKWTKEAQDYLADNPELSKSTVARYIAEVYLDDEPKRIFDDVSKLNDTEWGRLIDAFADVIYDAVDWQAIEDEAETVSEFIKERNEARTGMGY